MIIYKDNYFLSAIKSMYPEYESSYSFELIKKSDFKELFPADFVNLFSKFKETDNYKNLVSELSLELENNLESDIGYDFFIIYSYDGVYLVVAFKENIDDLIAEFSEEEYTNFYDDIFLRVPKICENFGSYLTKQFSDFISENKIKKTSETDIPIEYEEKLEEIPIEFENK